MTQEIEIDGLRFSLDKKGYLRDVNAWQPVFARTLAEADDIELTDKHWEVIEFVREYYFEYEEAPPMRLLTKALAAKLGAEKASSRHLYRLFPEGPAKQACRYAGLPKPISCI